MNRETGQGKTNSLRARLSGVMATAPARKASVQKTAQVARRDSRGWNAIDSAAFTAAAATAAASKISRPITYQLRSHCGLGESKAYSGSTPRMAATPWHFAWGISA